MVLLLEKEVLEGPWVGEGERFGVGESEVVLGWRRMGVGEALMERRPRE